ncbi:ABC transporter permease [Xylanibacillus composti]|uniref:ABC transporter permease n=1 Tax=Xylanibacillus composti TaxID=1572762 RepID=A0A8J4H902_9BACL|nr:ABC transporter permease [Xylanibacillus composti]
MDFLKSKGWILIRTLGKLCKVIYPMGRIYFISTVCFFAVLAVLPIVQLYMTKLLVDQIALIIQEGSDQLRHGFELLSLQLLLFIATPALTEISGLLRLRWLQTINFSFEREVTEKAMRVPLLAYETPAFYDQLQRATAGLGSKSVSVLEQLLTIFRNSLTLVGYAIVLFSWHWLLFVCMLAFVIPTLLAHWRMGRSKFAQTIYQTPSYRSMHYLQHTMRSREASKELRIFGHGRYLLAVWKQIYWKTAKEQFNLEQKFTKIKLAAETVSHTGSILLIGSFMWVGSRGVMTIGTYVSLYQAVASSQSLLQQMAGSIGNLYEDTLLVHDVFLLLDAGEEADEQAVRDTDRYSFSHCLQTEQLSFCYPSRSADTLKDISFSIQKGEKVAIVGENGAGKSTFVKCLLGLYPATSGRILIDGEPLAGDRAVQWRKQTSAVFQDFVHYHLTVKENIGISRADQLKDEEKIAAAAAAAGASEMIERLPDQYDALLGTPFVGGLELSGGLWQKIALSRAFFRDSDFIVLDEPTAALDPMAEAELLGKFMDIVEQKTAIIVTHRLGCCMHVDRIVVLKDGQIVEEGGHAALLEKNGEYARMFHAQAQWYNDKSNVTVSAT